MKASTFHSGLPAPRGRGASSNPRNRFEHTELIPLAEEYDPNRKVRTQYLRDTSSSIITRNNSPDVGFSAGVNPYRGCEHGCIYCYARPSHEFLGFSSGLEFETKIMVKEDAPRLLDNALASPKWKPEVLAMSGNTDSYQPIERKLKITRGCLEVLLKYRNPVAIVTKNHLVTRDPDLLSELARYRAAAVTVSITTLDKKLARKMEPRTATPQSRLDAVAKLAAAKVPVSVNIAPVIPGLNDEEIPAILKAAVQAGATDAAYIPLRLPYSVKDLFVDWLERSYPTKKEKILDRIRTMRGGKLNDPNFGSRMRGEGVWSEQINNLFLLGCKRAGMPKNSPALSTAYFRRPGGQQLQLF